VFSGVGTVVQLRAPAELRARVLSFYFLALGVLYPIGALIQGPIADRIGLGEMTVLSGIALVAVVGLVRLLRPERLAALDDPEHVPVVVPAVVEPT
jgi:predicted MFS family arabinose efflux permease